MLFERLKQNRSNITILASKSHLFSMKNIFYSKKKSKKKSLKPERRVTIGQIGQNIKIDHGIPKHDFGIFVCVVSDRRI